MQLIQQQQQQLMQNSLSDTMSSILASQMAQLQMQQQLAFQQPLGAYPAVSNFYLKANFISAFSPREFQQWECTQTCH